MTSKSKLTFTPEHFEDPSVSSLTKYPKIFDNTYWGAWRQKKNNKTITDDIINNRNKFIKDYNIKSCPRKTPRYVDKYTNRNVYRYLDHTEEYITNDGYYILISSPYANEDEHIKNGWVEIDKLYSTSATTFMKKIKRGYQYHKDNQN